MVTASAPANVPFQWDSGGVDHAVACGDLGGVRRREQRNPPPAPPPPECKSERWQPAWQWAGELRTHVMKGFGRPVLWRGGQDRLWGVVRALGWGQLGREGFVGANLREGSLLGQAG